MKISELIKDFTDKKICNSKINDNAVGAYLKQKLEIKTYIPFREKRMIAEMIVAQNIEEVNGIKKYDNIDGYISLIVASIVAHTNIEWSTDPVADYDLLAESGLLPQIIAEFQSSHDEIGTLLKMALAAELEDNNLNVLVGRFLNDILSKLDGVGEVLKDKFGNFDFTSILGEDLNPENLGKLKDFLKTYDK